MEISTRGLGRRAMSEQASGDEDLARAEDKKAPDHVEEGMDESGEDD